MTKKQNCPPADGRGTGRKENQSMDTALTAGTVMGAWLRGPDFYRLGGFSQYGAHDCHGVLFLKGDAVTAENTV